MVANQTVSQPKGLLDASVQLQHAVTEGATMFFEGTCSLLMPVRRSSKAAPRDTIGLVLRRLLRGSRSRKSRFGAHRERSFWSGWWKCQGPYCVW